MELIKKYKEGKLTTSDIRNLNSTLLYIVIYVYVLYVLLRADLGT